MVNSLLFKWEDSEALKHHCGFCERPLSHPGARASCFGKHSEPCVRFHQAMFMRLRGHTCKYCMGIDEQHYKRHHEIAERLRTVYESCGEVDWNIVPDESELDERGRTKDPGDEDTPTSKRERKDAKRLARAASRSRVITQDEIRYIDSIVHSAEGITSNEADGPRNPEEIEEIERQLRYHAHVYSTQVSRKGLRKLAEAPDDSIDVDFEAEMERILEIFRIHELLKRNTRTKGLQGKELKTFQTLVDGFKQAILEDIVLVKKDNAEVRMRRAGYLRYTSKTAYGIVEERYTGKDWKTGEKVASSLSDFSDAITPTDETVLLSSEQDNDQSPRRSRTDHSPDRRHLESNHKRVNGDDGLYHTDIEPYSTPLLMLPPAPTPNKQAAAVMVINVKASERRPVTVRGRPKNPQPSPDGWQVVTNGSTPTNSAVKMRAWGNVPSKPPAQAPRPGPTPWLSDSRDFPELAATRSSSDDSYHPAPAVKPPQTWDMQQPESFTAEVDGHPAISQRKKAKKAREAKRKAKNQSISEAAIDTSRPRSEAAEDVGKEVDVSTQGASMPSENNPNIQGRDNGKHVPSHTTNTIVSDEAANGVVESVATNTGFAEEVASVPLPRPIAVTKHGKHMHWVRFVRTFLVDQLTNPFPSSCSGCSHSTSCLFESNDILDCPFHEPHCPCVDPLADQCYLVMPCLELCSTGPFNRLRGQKLLSQYEKDHRTKGRLMLIDDDLINYFMEDPTIRARNRNLDGVPARLQKEYDDVKNGYNPGALMAQELRFERLYAKNGFVKQELTQTMLQDIQRNEFERPGTKYMCYCRAAVPKRGSPAKETIVCSYRGCATRYFHKSCAKKLGVEKVSRWYCTSCEQHMKTLSRQALRGLGYTDIPDEHSCTLSYGLDADKFEEMFDEKFKEMIDSPDMDYLELLPPDMRDKVKELGGLSSMPGDIQKQLKEKVRALGRRITEVDVRVLEI